MAPRENLYDDEAALEDPEEAKFDDSSEEDDDDDKFEEDDFIVNDEGDDVADDDEPGAPMHTRDVDDDDIQIKKRKKKKKRRYREDSPELAEGDLQLLREGGVRVDRKKKLKRLRKGASDEEDNLPYDDDVRVSDDEDDERFEERRRAADEPVDYDDDMDDFIDDGGRGRRRRAAEKEGLVSSETVRQARSIFGDIDDAANYKRSRKLFKTKEDGDDENDKDFTIDDEPEREGDEVRDARPLRTIRERETDRYDDIDDMPAPEPQADVDDEIIAQELGVGMDETPEVERVVQTDVPERLQNHFGLKYKAPNETEITEEAEWIYIKGFQDNPLFNDYQRFEPEEVKRKINVMLSYIHIDNLDIPFIAMYRKDYITPYLIRPAGECLRQTPTLDAYEAFDPSQAMEIPRGFNSYRYDDFRPGLSYEHKLGVPPGYDDGFGDWSILWHIFDLDKNYADLCQRRKQLLESAKHATDKGVPNLVTDGVMEVVPTCDDERLIADAERYLRLAIELAEALSAGMNDLDDDGARRYSRRRNNYYEYCKRGFRDLAQEFGLSARQIGENMRSADEYGPGVRMHVPLDAEGEPHILAGTFARRLDPHIQGEPGAPDDKHGEKALKAASHILVTEIVADVHVVRTARRILCKPGTVSVSTTPTALGIAQINDAHPLRTVTCLSEKKLESFRNTADFALVKRAVEQGYTKLEIVFQPEQITSFERSLSSAILAPEEGQSSVLVERWNKERMKLMDEVKASLITRMQSEVKDELEEMTALALRSKLTQAASRRLLLGPGRPIPQEEGRPRVLAFCVTAEEDEDPDPMQVSKDQEDAKEANGRMGDRRMARERLTIVSFDENGEYKAGYELFAGWLRRPMRKDIDASKLDHQVKEQLKSIITRSKAQIMVIGAGSGGKRAVRLQSDLMDLLKEMASTKGENDKDSGQRMHIMTGKEQEALRRADEVMNDPRGELNDKVNAMREWKEITSRYVVLVDDFPSRIYSKTEWSSIGMSMDAMTLLEKRAVALARMAQEPLWVYCAIGQEEEYALKLQFHPYHFYASPPDRLLALQRALCRAVCANGVDINRVLRLPHMKPMLSFVAGLGPHKAKALVEALETALGETERGLMSRKHLWSQNYLGRTVFLSTAAYLRVRDPEIHSGGSTRRAREIRKSKLGRKPRNRRRDDEGDGIFDPMDDSRIHPEHYAVAIKIADEALRDDEGNLRVELGDSEDFPEPVRMVSAVMEDATGLQRLALDEYAQHLEKRGRGCLYETVKTIASEFQGPYKDYRRTLVSPDPEATFFLVTHADPMMIRVGAKVTATECQLRRRKHADERGNRIFGITCLLPFEIRGFINPADFSDDRERLPDADLESLVPDGSTILCRISHFVYDRFEAGLTSKMSAMQDASIMKGYVQLVDTMDPAYRPYPAKPNRETNGASALPGRSVDVARRNQSRTKVSMAMNHLRTTAKPVVQHALFRDITGDDAVKNLQAMLPGDIIIRPSQYGKDDVVFSCKFATELPGMEKVKGSEGVFHVDCHMDQDPNDESIPLRLRVGENTYEDVEQVLEQYLRPIISNLSESLDHRKFRPGSENTLQSLVADEKRQNPKSIPYYFGISEKRPRSLVLVYVPGVKTVQTEEILVVPDGYRLRSVLHKNMDVLISWFKRNMRKGVTARRPITTSKEPAVPASPYVAAASPYRDTRSPYTEVRSPFREPRSPFVAPASPFTGARPQVNPPRSPFNPPRSPFNPPRSPFTAPRSPFTAPRSPFTARPTATPARDVPPPPAPSTPRARPDIPDPYAYDDPVPASEWNKATLHRDEPPPRVQNGGYDRAPPARRDYDYDMGMNDRAPPPRTAPDFSRGPIQRPPPPELPDSRGPDPRGPDSRGPDPRATGEARRPQEQRAPPNRGPPQRAGPPPRGPAPNRRGQRNQNGGNEGPMPSWRGAKPIPAWKKQQDAANS